MTQVVTAVIPCFNYGRFLARAIQSVLDQTYSPIECIVVNDGSTDETADVLRQFAGRVRVVEQPHRGVSAARNAALAVATGSLIAFLDGDDAWHPDKISEQVALLDARRSVGCVGCGLEHVYPDGRRERIPGRPNHATRRRTHRNLAVRAYWPGGSGSGVMVRRDVLERVGFFDEQLIAAEDWDMWLRIATETEIDNVPTVLVSINRHGTGIFRDAALMEANQWKVYHKLTEGPFSLGVADRRRLRALILSDAARESRDRRTALAYHVRSLRAWPFNWRRARAAAIVTARIVQSTLFRGVTRHA